MGVVLLVTACTRKEPAVATAEPDASVKASPAREPDASVKPAAELPPPVIPAAPSGADPEKVRLAASICAAAWNPARGVGCRSHPPFSGPDERPDGTIVQLAADDNHLCVLGAVHRGAFSRPGANEALLVFDACENDDGTAWDMANAGSAVLVDLSGGRVRAVATDGWAWADACVPVKRKDGVTLLACSYAFSAPPAGTVANTFVLDFVGGAPHQALLSVVYEDTPSCSFLDAKMPDVAEDGLTRADVARAIVTDVDEDGLGDVVVDVKRAHLPGTAALAAKLLAGCKKGQEPKVMPPLARTRLVFRNDGERLVPTELTRKALESWRAEAPSGMHGLPGSDAR